MSKLIVCLGQYWLFKLIFFSCMIQVNLNKQLIVIVERILSTVRVDPAKLVTVLRIVEREERYIKSRKFLT